ncbi:Basic-leucine zipper domain [Ceraceosorus bombacis]|uniref:Basic-leucine zipper domain n=1 Tax=Ceraceosorus bombacis TaxID=401625 RepID=A0A0P1BM20_9BASI|nr:Basic-leucine zipper domain [Ceraceosorus bombacis]
MQSPEASLKRKPAASAVSNPTKTVRRSVTPVSDDEGDVSGRLGPGEGGDAGNEPSVTKRTLQNRKAQREFRKRREARVRDLEERCRRFDQMGLEANAELQRIARRLKDENEALRGLLDSVNAAGHSAQRQHSASTSRGNAKDSAVSPSGLSVCHFDWQISNPNAYITDAFRGNQETGGNQTRPGLSQVKSRQRSQSSVPQIINIDGAQRGNARHSPSAISDGADGANNARPKSPLLSLRGLSGTQASANAQEKQQQNADVVYEPAGSSLGGFGGSGTGGSAMLGLPPSASQQFSTATTANIAGNMPTNSSSSLFPFPQRTYQNDALLNPNPIPFAFNLSSNASHSPPDQSWWDAMCGGGMLTPGQDPTALDEKAQVVAAAQQQSNSDRSSGGPSGIFGGTPIDFSAFLSGGFTPTGTFGAQNFDGSQANDVSRLSNQRSNAVSMEKKLSASPSMPPPMPPTAHAQMFLRLLERKLASRDFSPYASLGFQPPSMYQDNSATHQTKDAGTKSGSSMWRIPSSTDRTKATTIWRAPGHGSSPLAQSSSAASMTPSSVYSRLSQHPAFLRTSEKELEELVDALEPRHSSGSPSSGRSASTADRSAQSLERRSSSQSSNRSSDDFFTNATRQKDAVAATQARGQAPNTGRPPVAAGARKAPQPPESGAARSPHSSAMELDENAVTQILDMLDAKRGGNQAQSSHRDASDSNAPSMMAT